MADFDPDAYLAGSGGTALAEPPAPAPAFDPDAYLKQSQPAAAPEFNPDEYLKQPPAPQESFWSAMAKSPANPASPLILGLGKALDYAKEKINEFSPGFLEQATTSPIHYELQQSIAGAQPQKTDTALEAFRKGVGNKVAGFIDSMSSPAMVATLGAGAVPGLAKPVAAAFLADTVSSLPDAYKAVRAAENGPLQQRVEAGIDLASLLTFSHLLSKHITGKAPEITTPKTETAPEAFDPDAYLSAQPSAEKVVSETARVAPPESSAPEESASAGLAGATTAQREAEYQAMSANLSELNKDQFLPAPEITPPTEPATTNLSSALPARNASHSDAGGRPPPSDPGGFTDSPLVSFIRDDVGGILSKSAARDKWGAPKYEENSSLWDDAPSLRNPAHNQIYNARTGVAPDEAATAAADAGLLPPDATHTDLWRALQNESDAAHSRSAQVMAQRVNERTAIAQQRAFTTAIEQPIRGEKPIQGADLNVGDTVRIGTEQMRVTAIDPDTYDATLEDGSKFGIQHVQDNQAIYGEVQRPTPEASMWMEQEKVPFGFGPGAAAMGENLRVASQIKQLTSTVTDSLRTERPAPMQSRLQKAINAAGGAVVSARESLGRAAQTARSTWLALKNGYLRPPVEGEFKSAIKDWQGADQRTSFEVRKFAQTLRQEVRDPLIRDAITNYIQADGDAALLRQRANASNIKYRPGYEAALNLTDAQKTLAANVRQYFDAMLQDGINAGILDHGIESYINQIWKRPNKFTQQLQADLQAGKLQTNFQFARKRMFGSFFEGEQARYAPASKDVSALVAAYDLSFNRSLAARGFVKALRDAKAADGEAVAKFSGAVQPLRTGDAPPEAYLIRARTRPESAVAADGRAYQIVDHPALRGWKFVVQDGAEKPAYYQADMLVHPDHVADLQNILGRSAFRQGKLGAIVSPMLKLGAIAKQTKLSLSLFHLDQEGLHGLFHRVNPANLAKINFDDPAQWSLVRNGLQVADYHASELFAEGLRGGGLISKIPVLGELQNRFNEFLFKDYIPRLKMTMALHALERNAKRYPQLAPDVLAELTGRQANAAFGELNYKLMARNPTLQDFLRLTVLAPDFLEARSRFVGQALKPYGREQQVALMLGAATMYVTARVLNQWLDNDPHWAKPFSLIYNGREYRLRTVMGDAAEVFLDPRRFFYNRLSPWLKTGVTVGTGRDYRGVKLNNVEQVKDALSWFVPIPLAKQENANIPQRILGSAGVQNKPAPTAVNNIYDAARSFREKLAMTEPKIAAEVKRAEQETYAASDYGKLNRALADKDNEAAAAEIQSLIKDKGKTVAELVKYYGHLPARPFSGSQALEARFLQQMPEPQRAQYRAARNEQIGITQRFFQVLQTSLPPQKSGQ